MGFGNTPLGLKFIPTLQGGVTAITVLDLTKERNR